MPQYLVSGYLPDNFDPSSMTEAKIEAIHALNREMIAAGVRKFACGLSPKTTTLRAQPNGDVLVTDGPYLEARNTWAVFRYWNAQTWTKRSRGRTVSTTDYRRRCGLATSAGRCA